MLSPGQRISEYLLDAQLGAGAFGVVWRARHHVWNDQLVAIKIPTDPAYVRNLQREGAAIHGLVHPNIVRAIGFDPYANPPYLVMEYIPGTSLRTLIAEKKLSIRDATSILRQVLLGLKHAHDNGVVHRDIKPENILIHERATTEGFDADGVVKVTDFGLGKAATQVAVGSIAYSQSFGDAVGRDIAGTVDYMSPEARAGEADHRADLYSCGVVLYELLTGHRPAGMEMPSDLNPQVPQALNDVFKKAYARLEKRYGNAQEFLDALPVVAPPLPSPIKPPPVAAAKPSLGPQRPPGEICAHCHGKGQDPNSDWGFCDMCRGRGHLEGTDANGYRIEIKCGKCNGRGTKPPEKCPICKGTGRSSYAPVRPAPPVSVQDAGYRQKMVSCPQCRQTVEETDQFCMHCGVQLVTSIRRCAKCGAYPDASDRFCIFCGETLNSGVKV